MARRSCRCFFLWAGFVSQGQAETLPLSCSLGQDIFALTAPWIRGLAGQRHPPHNKGSSAPRYSRRGWSEDIHGEPKRPCAQESFALDKSSICLGRTGRTTTIQTRVAFPGPGKRKPHKWLGRRGHASHINELLLRTQLPI